VLFGRDRRKEFEGLALPLSGQLFKVAYWRLGKKEDAEDVCQETYLRAYRSFHTFSPGTNMKAWLTTILINVINDFRKKQAHVPEPTDEEVDFERLVVSQSESFKDPSIRVEEDEIDSELFAALQQLPSTFLHPLLLREIEDLSYSDIATVLAIPVGTVMSRLYRARQLLKSSLEKCRTQKQTASIARGVSPNGVSGTSKTSKERSAEMKDSSAQQGALDHDL